MNKRGVTIIELLVAMTIFIVVVTLAVGAFATVSRMKALTSTMKETQQKTRIALEMMTRLSRQAEKVITTDNTLDLYFDIRNTPKGVRFAIENDIDDTTKKTLYYYECENHKLDCTSWVEKNDLYSGIAVSDDESVFKKEGTIPPLLTINLLGNIDAIDGNKYYSDKININTSIILESIK